MWELAPKSPSDLDKSGRTWSLCGFWLVGPWVLSPTMELFESPRPRFRLIAPPLMSPAVRTDEGSDSKMGDELSASPNLLAWVEELLLDEDMPRTSLTQAMLLVPLFLSSSDMPPMPPTPMEWAVWFDRDLISSTPASNVWILGGCSCGRNLARHRWPPPDTLLPPRCRILKRRARSEREPRTCLNSAGPLCSTSPSLQSSWMSGCETDSLLPPLAKLPALPENSVPENGDDECTPAWIPASSLLCPLDRWHATVVVWHALGSFLLDSLFFSDLLDSTFSFPHLKAPTSWTPAWWNCSSPWSSASLFFDLFLTSAFPVLRYSQRREPASATLVSLGIQRQHNEDEVAINKQATLRHTLSKDIEELLPLSKAKTMPRLSFRCKCAMPKLLIERNLWRSAATIPRPSNKVICSGICICWEKQRCQKSASKIFCDISWKLSTSSKGSSHSGRIGLTVCGSSKGSPWDKALDLGRDDGHLPLNLHDSLYAPFCTTSSILASLLQTAIPDNEASEAVTKGLKLFRKSAAQSVSKQLIHRASTAAPCHSLHFLSCAWVTKS